MKEYLTVSKYAKRLNISTVAVYKQIKNNKVKTKKENNRIYIEIIKQDKLVTNLDNLDSNQTNQELMAEITLLQTKLKAEEKINSTNQNLITALQEHNNTLKITCSLLERENQKLLDSEDIQTKNIYSKEEQEQTEENTNLNTKNFNEFLDEQKIKGNDRKKIRTRFKRAFEKGNPNISKNENGTFLINPKIDYSKLLKP